jgi:hypothetical protein
MPMKVARIESLARRLAVIARQDGDERFLQNQLKTRDPRSFVTQEGDVKIDTDLNPRPASGRFRRRRLPRSTVTAALTMSRRWWRSSLARKPLTSPAQA